MESHLNKKQKTDDEGGVTGKKRGRKPKIFNVEIDNYTYEELVYYKKQPDIEKQRIADEEQKMHDLNNSSVPLRFKVLNSDIDPKVKAIAIQKLNLSDPGSSDFTKTISWVEAICKIPFGKYKSLPVGSGSKKEDIKDFLHGVKKHMDDKVYGHQTAKDHMIRLLAQWISNPLSKGMVIGIHGSMGCGKTMLVKEGICKALGLPFAFIPLGGANDGCFLEGHSYTYEGATWGKIVDVLMKTGVMNPVLFFDELDKVSDTHKGEEIINILVHLTDSTQNDKFTDKYFVDLDFDLSRCLIIFSYNHEDRINPILRDRMVKISTNGYSIHDKVAICKDYMIPEVLKEYNFDTSKIVFDDKILKEIISTVDDEKGVRNLKRALQDIIGNINLNKLLEMNSEIVDDIHYVTSKDLKKYIHNIKKDNVLCNMMYI